MMPIMRFGLDGSSVPIGCGTCARKARTLRQRQSLTEFSLASYGAVPAGAEASDWPAEIHITDPTFGMLSRPVLRLRV